MNSVMSREAAANLQTWTGDHPMRRAGRSVAEAGEHADVPKYTVTLLVPTDAIGLLIGKGGSTLKEVTQQSKARLALQDFNDVPRRAKERGVLLTGTFEAIASAEKLILERLRGRRPKTDSDEIQLEDGKVILKWVIPNDRCGLLIGRGGSGIKEINEQSGAWVKVAHEQEMMPGAVERTVYITGTPEQNEAAKQMIVSQVGGRPFSATVGLEPGSATMYVPCRAIGHLLGIGGAGIKEITALTGAKVRITNLSEMDMGSTQVRAIITGPSEESIAAAKQQMQNRLDEWYQDKGQHLGLGPHLEEESSVKFTIPLPLIGQVIGKSGSFIQSIYQKHNAVIKIMQDTPSPSMTVDERPLAITGAMDNMLQAQELLLQRIEHAAANYPGVLYRMPTQPPPGHAPDPRLFHGFEGFVPSPRDSYSTADASSTAETFGDSFVNPSEINYYPVNRPDLTYMIENDFEHNRAVVATSSPVVTAMNHMPPNSGNVELGYMYTYNVRYPPTVIHPTMVSATAAAAANVHYEHNGAPPPHAHARGNGHVDRPTVAHLEEAMPMLSLQWTRSGGLPQHARPRRPSRDMTS